MIFNEFDNRKPKFRSRIVKKPTFVPPKEEGVSLETVVREFMMKIGKTLADVQDVKVDGTFITVFMTDESEPMVIEVAPPGTDFPVRH